MLKFHIVLLFLTSILFGQVEIIELPSIAPDQYFSYKSNSKFIPFESDWELYKPDQPDKRISVDLPVEFNSEADFIFEKAFDLAASEKGKNFILHCMGISYSADFILNDIVVFRHTGGTYPFNVKLPGNLLNFDGKNSLKIEVKYFSDPEITIPLEQKFLFPIEKGGIFRDLFLEVLPPVAIENVFHNFQFDYKRNRINVESKIKFVFDEELLENNHNKKFTLKINAFNSERKFSTKEFTLKPSTDLLPFNISIDDTKLFSNPRNLKLRIGILDEETLLFDFIQLVHPFDLSLTDRGFELGGKKFRLKGTTFIPLENNSAPKSEYYKKQIQFIADAGFNVVRFNKSLPDPLVLNEVQSQGLFALIDIPLDGLPDNLAEDKDFEKRALNYIQEMIESYSAFDNVIGFGIGSSYVGSSFSQINFLKNIIPEISKNTDKYIYASFIDFPKEALEGLDFYGVQFFAEQPLAMIKKLNEFSTVVPKGRILASSVTYPAVYGKSNGYLDAFSIEAQAKYFYDVISHFNRNDIPGFFINSIFNYRGNYSSLFAGYSEINEYSIGIQPSPDKPKSFAYEVVKSKLTGGKKINIPLGTQRDRSPIFFVIVALVLAIIMGILVNTKRKFREDATRALLRSYNFYADIRDHRILSGVHTFILMIVIAGTHSLLITILLYFLRMNILLEKILIALNTTWITDFVSYLAWNPVESSIIIFGLSIGVFLTLSVVIKLFSVFVKQRILFSNIYFVVVWSFLPIVLLLPLEIILNKILILNQFNLFIYAVLFIFLLIVILRLLKGVYVIFDVNPSSVYSVSIMFLLVFLGIVIIYFHYTNNSFYQILNALNQHPLI